MNAILLAVLLQLNPLIGGFTESEKTSLRHLRQAMSRTLNTISAECGTGASGIDWTQERIYACASMAAGFYEFVQGAGWLFHVNVNPNDDGGEAFLLTPRPNVVAGAWKEIDRGLYEVSHAAFLFAGTRNYDEALKEVSRIDRTLPYASPFPPSYPKQFAIHGDYSPAQKRIWSVTQYGVPSIIGWLTGQYVGELPACSGFIESYTRALRLFFVDAWFMSAEVILPTNVYARFQTPFVKGLPDDHEAKRGFTEFALIFGPVNEGGGPAAYQFRFVLTGIGACLAEDNPYLNEVLRRLGDSWTNGDLWGGIFLGSKDGLP